MRYKWLNKKSNEKLIIFFNGWGMDEGIINHLDPENYDILMFYDYNSLDTDFDFKTINNYNEKYLISWSMGVMVASNFINKLGTLSKKIAINGTLKPIDAEFGIHPKIFNLTISGFNENGQEKFINSMFEIPTKIVCNRELENQLSELIALKNYSPNENFEYNKILISNNDKIIPTKSQVKFWQIEPNIDGGHCPFFNFKKWSELL